MGHLENVLPQMTHPPEFAFRIIALSFVVDRQTLFLAVMVRSYLPSYFGRDHAPRRPVTLRKISIASEKVTENEHSLWGKLHGGSDPPRKTK